MFGVGAAGTWAGLYIGPAGAGAIISSGNSVVNQGFDSNGSWNWSNVSGQQVLFDGVMGGMTAQLGSSLGGVISPYVSKLTSGIGGQAVQQAITQGVTGSATGFTLTTGFALMHGESFEDALKQGGDGALMGLGLGLTTGMISGMRTAYKANENPWTGNALGTKMDWNYGDHKSQTKWQNQMNQRGWTEQQINEAMFLGKSHPAQNNINPGNGATRYVHPNTGRSVVIDNITGRILHVGGDGFKY